MRNEETTATHAYAEVKMAALKRCDADVKITGESQKEDFLLEHEVKCDFCKANKSKYTCPRCSLRYCGIECYKSPDHRKCSEDFYKDNVMRELKNLKSTDETKKKTMEILKRVMQNEKHEDSGVWNDDESIDSLAKRMEDINIETASFEEMYCRLTAKERKLFESVIQSGEVEIEDLCTPWWMIKSNGSQMVQEIKKDNGDLTVDKDVPSLIQNISTLKDLLPNKQPSDKMSYNIIEVITLYCFLYRVYNGELKESLLEVLDTLISLSRVLADNCLYESTDICLRSLVHKIKGLPSFKDNVDPVQVSLSDLKTVLNSKCATNSGKDEVPMSLLCIADLYNLFTAGVNELKQLKKKTNESKEKRNLYFRISKKLLFMATWLTEKSTELKQLSCEVETLQMELCTYWETIKEEKKIIENKIGQIRENRKASLIEEL